MEIYVKTIDMKSPFSIFKFDIYVFFSVCGISERSLLKINLKTGFNHFKHF